MDGRGVGVGKEGKGVHDATDGLVTHLTNFGNLVS